MKPRDSLDAGKSPDAMNFLEFIPWSQHILRRVPDVTSLCETRVSRAFEDIRPTVQIPNHFGPIHRCDLAQEWCEVRGLPSELARRTLLCEGVRHGLGLIFCGLAKAGRRVALPTDVYPVYWRIAVQSGVDATGIETFPEFNVEDVLDRSANAGADIVVLPAPLKLHGRPWAGVEVAEAIRWLRAQPQRRMILDGVYSFGLPLGAVVNGLLETDQVIYLDSLSKGWLNELVLGVAFVPQSDFDIYADSFMQLNLAQEKLFVARDVLRRFRQFPVQFTVEIDKGRRALLKRFDQIGLRTLSAEQGYFVVIEDTVSRLLEEHQLLTIPAAAFGSRFPGWSIASALPAVRA